MEAEDTVGGSYSQTSRTAATRETKEETRQEINKDQWVFLGKETNSKGEICHNWITYIYGDPPTTTGKPANEHSQNIQWVELKRFCHLALRGDIFKYEKKRDHQWRTTSSNTSRNL